MPQARPQAPQLFGSLETSAQLPFVQRTVPAPQVHMPIAHIPPGPQETMHEPQCAGSVASEAHALPQATCPVGHTHTPEMQGAAVGQARPHIPQFAVLVCRSTQLPPHTVFGAMQPPLQTPDVQLCPGAHERLHPPQLAGSLARFAHAAPQSTVSAGQAPSVGAIWPSISELPSRPPPPSLPPVPSSGVDELPQPRSPTNEHTAAISKFRADCMRSLP
jgi:hypothetical protein